MKVYPNAPAYPSQGVHNELDRPTHFRHEGIPIRLAIAAQIAGALIPVDDAGIRATTRGTPEEFAAKLSEAALRLADALIAAHNRGQA